MGDFLFGKKPARKYKTRGWALVVGLRWVARIKVVISKMEIVATTEKSSAT